MGRFYIFIILSFFIISCGLSSPLAPQKLDEFTLLSRDFKSIDFEFIQNENTTPSEITLPLYLPKTAPLGSSIVWIIEPEDAVDSEGYIQPLSYKSSPQIITIEAQISRGNQTKTKQFELTLPFLDYHLIEEPTPEGYLNIEESGVIEDPEDPDVYTELQAAIDLAESENKNIFIPAGIFNLEQPVNPFPGLTFAGSSKGLSIIQSSTQSFLVRLETDVKTDLVFRNLVFDNVGLYFNLESGQHENILIENCVFIMDNFTTYTDIITMYDCTNVRIINSTFLIRSVDTTRNYAVNSFQSNHLRMEGNIIGFNSDTKIRLTLMNSEILNQRLLKLNWLEDKGYYTGDMDINNNNYGLLINQSFTYFENEADIKIYNNYFFGRESGRLFSTLRMNSTEIGGNLFYGKDLIGSGILLNDSKELIFAENYLHHVTVEMRSAYISDITNELSDIFIVDNILDTGNIIFYDQDNTAVTVRDLVISNNQFSNELSLIFLEDDNITTGDYDRSAFTIDLKNKYTTETPPLLNIITSGFTTGTINQPAVATIPTGAIPYYRPDNYSQP